MAFAFDKKLGISASQFDPIITVATGGSAIGQLVVVVAGGTSTGISDTRSNTWNQAVIYNATGSVALARNCTRETCVGTSHRGAAVSAVEPSGSA